MFAGRNVFRHNFLFEWAWYNQHLFCYDIRLLIIKFVVILVYKKTCTLKLKQNFVFELFIYNVDLSLPVDLIRTSISPSQWVLSSHKLGVSWHDAFYLTCFFITTSFHKYEGDEIKTNQGLDNISTVYF